MKMGVESGALRFVTLSTSSPASCRWSRLH